MRSRIIRTAAAALLLGLTAACSDAPSPSAPELAPSAAPRQAVWTAGDTTYTTFTYNPGAKFEQTFAGVHKLVMADKAVCDPRTSGYGAGTWDSPCTAATSAITFTSKAWRDAAGRPQITFSPDVRFVPGKTVTLRLNDETAAASGTAKITWCPSDGSACVVESNADKALAEQYDAKTGMVTRRLKHFSGYQIVLGKEDDGSTGDGSY